MINRILHINKKTDLFSLREGENELACAICTWTKIDADRVMYITGVESHKAGNGSLLMESIISHFSNLLSKPTRKGYNRSHLWLKVLPDNLRAIALYKKFGFVDAGYNHEYNWMFKKL